MHGAFAAEQISELAKAVAVELLADSGQAEPRSRSPGGEECEAYGCD